MFISMNDQCQILAGCVLQTVRFHHNDQNFRGRHRLMLKFIGNYVFIYHLILMSFYWITVPWIQSSGDAVEWIFLQIWGKTSSGTI